MKNLPAFDVCSEGREVFHVQYFLLIIKKLIQ